MIQNNGIYKKVASRYTFQPYYSVPFLERPLQSILLFMQEQKKIQMLQSTYTRPIYTHPFVYEQSPVLQDPESYMYYNLRNKFPFDYLSIKQMEIFGGTFSIDSNKDALIKISPINSIQSSPVIYGPYNQQIVESQPYLEPIGPLSFLSSTVPYKPKKEDLDFLDSFSKK